MTERGMGSLPHPVSFPAQTFQSRRQLQTTKSLTDKYTRLLYAWSDAVAAKQLANTIKSSLRLFFFSSTQIKTFVNERVWDLNRWLSLFQHIGLAYSSRASDSSCLYLMLSIKAALRRNNRTDNPTLTAVITNVDNCSLRWAISTRNNEKLFSLLLFWVWFYFS